MKTGKVDLNDSADQVLRIPIQDAIWKRPFPKVYGTCRFEPEVLGLPNRTLAGDVINFVEVSGG